MEPIRARVNREDLLEQAAVRLSFDGASVIERRLIPDEGYTIEEDGESDVVYLKDDGGGLVAEVQCDCGLEGGTCTPVSLNPGDIDEHVVCLADEGCGTSGLFCFMEVRYPDGPALRFKM